MDIKKENEEIINDKNEKEEENNENENENKESRIDINSLKVEELKNVLKKRNIEIPKNAKKKDLQELLMNTDK